jgi:hypothetical protein
MDYRYVGRVIVTVTRDDGTYLGRVAVTLLRPEGRVVPA